MKLIVIILVMMAVPFFWAMYHDGKIDKTKSGNYDGGFPDMFARFWVIMAFSFVYLIWVGVEYPEGLWRLALTWIRLAGVFWLMFDIWLNMIRGKPFTYISTTNGKIFDSLFKGNFSIQLATKIMIIII